MSADDIKIIIFDDIQNGYVTRPILRWADNIKIDLRGIGWGGMDWIDLA
jgi:predicted nucleotidyltransferase